MRALYIDLFRNGPKEQHKEHALCLLLPPLSPHLTATLRSMTATLCDKAN